MPPQPGPIRTSANLYLRSSQSSGSATSNPTGDDTLLGVEVADFSLSIDRGVKLPKYADAGIQRYWVVDVKNPTFHDYRDPDRFGRRYRQLHSLTGGPLSVSIEGVDIPVDIDDLFRA